MKITAEIEVKFDEGDPDILECDIDADEIADEIQGAVSGCDGISDVASVEVKKLTLQESHGHAATHTLPGSDRKERKCSTTPNSRTARSAAAASTRTRKARNRTT